MFFSRSLPFFDYDRSLGLARGHARRRRRRANAAAVHAPQLNPNRKSEREERGGRGKREGDPARVLQRLREREKIEEGEGRERRERECIYRKESGGGERGERGKGKREEREGEGGREERGCHTRFWKANRMRTMYVPGSELTYTGIT